MKTLKDMSPDELVIEIRARVDRYKNARENWGEGGTSEYESMLLALKELASRAS